MTQPPLIFDRKLALARRESAAQWGFFDFLHDMVGRDLAERLTDLDRRFPLAVDLSAGTGTVSEALLKTRRIGRLIHMEASPTLLDHLPEPKLAGDEECLPFLPQTFDLIVSALSLQAVNDLPGALTQIRAALKPGGIFLGAMLGAGTLQELRDSFLAAETMIKGGASPRVAPFTDLRDAGALLQRAGFLRPVTDLDHKIVRYHEPENLFIDLYAMGFRNSLANRSRTPLRYDTLTAAEEIYKKRFSDPDGRIRASFVIIYMFGKA